MVARPNLATAIVRVAVYVRQSVDDARSAFGSIEAQGEAVETYVRSQAALGWQALPERFVDRGFSGKNTARPGFQSMLKAIRAGAVDMVAVHRLDRISRSLADLVAMLAEFRVHNVEFVSTTQGFNTSTPVGRMTVNLLGSFAEFERETISERTRLKIEAARRKGMWTAAHPLDGLRQSGRGFVRPRRARIRPVRRKLAPQSERESGPMRPVVDR